MSKTIDERVVSMQFDNRRFESNVQTSLATINRLKESLKFDGVAKGFDSINSAAKGVDMSGLSRAAELVESRFSALGIMGVTALQRITNSAIDAGKRIVSALTIDPIKTGFQEYETQINAVQTILANTESKGTTLKDVNAALDELNEYADMTIYNFTEMTRNIGTFTAAGVELDTSVNAIKGIANLAAVSGSTSQQASTAMYQLSQAMASGTVKLQDWNSVVNAGMGGQVFQDALKETAKAHGIKMDEMIEKDGSFRETLKRGWLTTDVLTETLMKFTLTTEGLTEAQIEANREMLRGKGYTEEQIDEIFKLGNTATNAATKVKTFTQLFDTLKESAQSGWTQTWEILVGDFEEAKETLTKVSEVLGDIINKSAQVRNELLQAWKDAGGRTHIIDSFANVFNAILSVVTPIKEAFSEIFPPITVQQLLKFTEGIKNLTSKLTLSDTASDNLKRTFKGLFAVVDIVRQAFASVLKIFVPLLSGVTDIGGGILSITASWGDWLVSVNESIKKFDVFGKAAEKIKEVVTVAIGAVLVVFKKVSEFMTPIIEDIKAFGLAVADTFANVVDTANTRLRPLGILGEFIKGIFGAIAKMVHVLTPWISAAISGIGNVIGGLMTDISDAIANADYAGAFDILNGGVFAAIGVFIAKFLKSGSDLVDGASGFLENINGILEGVGDALNSFTQSLKAKTLKEIATAIAILAGALLVLSFIDSEKLGYSLGAISVLFAELMVTMSMFAESSDSLTLKGAYTTSKLISGIASALLVLSVAVKIMSTMSWKEMGVGLITMVVGLGALVGAVNLLPDRKVNSAAKAIGKMSSALLVLAVAIKIMSTMSWKEMGVGLITMVVGLGALVGAVNLLPKDAGLKAAGMLGIAAAMVVLAAALKIMATMSWSEMIVSLVGLAGSLAILVAAMTLMKSALPGAAATLIVAPALLILCGVMKVFGDMSWGEILKSLVMLAGSLLILAGAMQLMQSALAGAAALIVISGALAIFAPALKLLGSMSIGEVVTSLVALAGAFAVIGLAALILEPVVPAIAALAGSMLLFGVGCLAAGAGIAAAAIGLATLATALAASGAAIVLFVTSIVGLIPYIITQLGLAIVQLCEVIAGGSKAICEAVVVIVIAVVDALIAAVPKLTEGVFVLLVELLRQLIKYVPTIVTMLVDFLITVLDSLATNIVRLVDAALNVVMTLFAGVIEALKTIDPKVLVNGLLSVGLMVALMAGLSAMASLTPSAMAGVIGVGLVVTELGLVLAALGKLYSIPGISDLISDGGDLLLLVGTAIGKFIGGIAGGLASGVSSSLPKIGDDLSAFMTNVSTFIDGAKGIDSSSLDGVKTLVGVILALTAANVIDGLTSWFTGGSSLADFGKEIAEFAPNLKLYSDAVAGIDGSVVKASAEAASALAEMTSHIPNSGGMVAWFTGENSIAQFGEELVTLGESLKSYSESVAGINAESIVSSANAAKALAEMSSHIPNSGGVAAWFAGENSIAQFGKELVTLGDSLSKYSTAISGFDGDAVIASANAAKVLAEMTDCIPNSGGVAAWFAGENSIATFGAELVLLGASLSRYSVAIKDFDSDAVIKSTDAAKALAEMTTHIPNSGGMVAWFTGDNSIAMFGTELVLLGNSLAMYSKAIGDFDSSSVIASANAAKALAEMTTHIPNTGGMVSWFTGDNSVARFGAELVELGVGLNSFASNTSSINTNHLSSVVSAAKSLAEMTTYIPNTGGMVSWFTGDNSVAQFGEELISLGLGLNSFASNVSGIDSESVLGVVKVAQALTEMSGHIPNSGGMVAWFTGDNSVAKFGEELVSLGTGLNSFATNTSGIKADHLASVVSAAKALAEMATYIPNSGGMIAWFTGDNSVADFGEELGALGAGLSKFASNTSGINSQNVVAAANAAKSLAEMTTHIPNSGGMAAWFTGENSVAEFGEDIAAFGGDLADFATAVDGINATNVTAAATAAKSLADMMSKVPKEENLLAWFSGDSSVAKFGDEIADFGDDLSDFADEVEDIKPENVKAASEAAETLVDIADDAPDEDDLEEMATFGDALDDFGDSLASYFDEMKGISIETINATQAALEHVGSIASTIDPTNTKNVANSILRMVESIEKMAGVDGSSVDGFVSAISEMAAINTDAVIAKFDGAGPKMVEAGAKMMSKFVEGMTSKKVEVSDVASTLCKEFADRMKESDTVLTREMEALIQSCSDIVTKDPGKIIYNAGAFFVTGFAFGIKENTYIAVARAKEMASAAAKAVAKELDEHSPSKVGYKIGNFFGLAFVNAIGDNVTNAYDVGSKLAKSAKSGLNDSISKIRDIIVGDIDVTPTIRPVLDLSDVRNGAGSIANMLNANASINANTNIGAISSMMRDNNQNGKDSDELISAVRGLRKDIANMPRNSYNINGITYDDGSNVANAVETLIRAAKIEGRV